MTGKWVLVTGGSRGIGRGIVNMLAADLSVVFTWRADRAASEKAMADNPSAVAIQCDGSDEAQVKHCAETLLHRFGPPAGIVHNAGIALDGLHIHLSSAQWHQVMDTNLNALFYWNQALLPAMIEQGGGSVVFISSVSGAVRGNTGQTAYSATKSAMLGLCRSLALETGRFGIRVNCVAPGMIESEMLNTIPADKRRMLARQIPLRRVGKPEDVAAAVRFLLGEESRWITGQLLTIDGGMSI